MSYLLETKDLTKSYKGTNVVSNLNLKIPKGSIYGFLGENGAGKTTTIRMILGLVQPNKGSIHLFGEKLNYLHYKKIGALIESPSAFGHLSGEENLRYFCSLRGTPTDQIYEVLEKTKLMHTKDKKFKHYSLGMKQRLGLAISLLGDPKFLILDEPTNGLDPSGIQEMRELIKSLPRSGHTVLISSHLLSEIEQVATHVGVIDKGNLLYQGDIEEFTKQRGGNKIRIKATPTDVVTELLTELGKNPQWMNEECVFEGEESEIAELLRKFQSRNIKVSKVTEEKSSLEGLFLDLIHNNENTTIN